MRNLTPALALALAACGGAPQPQPGGRVEAEAPASAPVGHRHHHGGPHAHHADPENGEPAVHHHHHGFEDPAAWAAKWDTAERDGWQKPDAVLDALALAPTHSVADIGAGTGYFAMRLAARVPQGRVYAVDLEAGMVKYLGERAAQLGLGNVQPVLATTDDPRIPEPVDVVMLTNTYHHIEDRSPYFARLAEKLAPDGRVAIVDYKLAFDGPGPPEAMRLSPEAVIAEMKAAGYSVLHRDEQLLPRQYLLIFGR